VVDINQSLAQEVANLYQCKADTSWQALIDSDEIDVVVVATHNGLLAEISIAAMQAGKHVLIEKPMGRNLSEAIKMSEIASQSKKLLKIGFNHRYHPALAKAYQLYKEGLIGEIINIRARYGHGGRPGYENEWRGNPELAGGGELTDQGVHVVDLINWFAGIPAQGIAFLQTAVWPLSPLEDNGFGMFKFSNGAIANLHTSWTQWKNLFSFEIYGTKGSLTIEGLGKSYGIERLIIAIRNPAGGVPEMHEEIFDEPDFSWKKEWQDFMNAITHGDSYWGTSADGLAAMKMIDSLYRSSREGKIVDV
jgi:predicted dehydrogenase